MPDLLHPTRTLAELYESQNQLLDALVVYQKLMHLQPSPEIENKITELKLKIFNDKEMVYNPVIEQIFSKEERILFNILPHSYYKKIQSTLNQPKLDSMEDLSEVDNEPVISEEYHNELDKVFREFELEHKDLLFSKNKENLQTTPAGEDLSSTENKLPEDTNAEIKNQDLHPSADLDRKQKNQDIDENNFFNVPFDELINRTEKGKDNLQTNNILAEKEITSEIKDAETFPDEPEKTEPPATLPHDDIEMEDFSAENQDNLEISLEEKFSRIAPREEAEIIKVDDEIEDEIIIQTDLNKTESELRPSEKNDETSPSNENLIADTIVHDDKNITSDDWDFTETKFSDEVSEEAGIEKPVLKPDNPEDLSFDDLVNLVDDQQDLRSTAPEVETESTEDPKPSQENLRRSDFPELKEEKDRKEEPFQYAEDDISLKELEAELKAEFQRTRKQTLQETTEETEEIIDLPLPDTEPILSDQPTSEKPTENEPVIREFDDNLPDHMLSGEKETPTNKPDSNDLDKSFSDISPIEDNDQPTESKPLEKTDLDFDNHEIKNNREENNSKRFSEYVPGAIQPEDDFFNQSFDELAKQKEVGFKAEDVLKNIDKKKDGKEKKE